MQVDFKIKSRKQSLSKVKFKNDYIRDESIENVCDEKILSSKPMMNDVH